MIKNTFVVLMCSWMSTTCAQQWSQISSPYGGNLRCIEFFDQNIGYIGSNTELLKTTDGGNSWTTTPISGFSINGFSFPTSTVGFYGLNNNVIRKTTDQGATWTGQNPNASPFGIKSLSFVDANNGWAVGGGGTIRKTTNGGTTWTTQSAGVGTSDLNKVHFFNSTNGICIGDAGKIRRTVNGGASWSVVAVGASADLLGMHFVDANTGYIVGASGTILKTTNGGQNWMFQTSGTTAWLYSVCFKNATEGIAGSTAGLILRTSDGGANWVQENIGIFVIQQAMNDIIYQNGRYIAVGDAGRIATDQLMAGMDEVVPPPSVMTISPNPANDAFTVDLMNVRESDLMLNIYSVTGVLLRSEKMNSSHQRFDVGSLGSGSYLVELRSDKTTAYSKLVVQQ
ncbi:MAG: T9SS type A sorting domain-containing protein [Flavobacteriales bacterium]|nr:T9SS type A sorting domain-containing protein [Flavobacteriales bacterium]